LADKRALKAARKLARGNNASQLTKLVGREEFGRLLAALVRTKLGGDYDRVKEEAAAC